jgi:hypothetical protein
MSFIYKVPKETEIIVIADFFDHQIVGGAELTTAAILEKCPYKYFQINAESVTPNLIEKYKDKYWLIGNCAKLSRDSIITFVTEKVRYSKVECDYLYCRYRSSHLHKIQTGQVCDCHKNNYGKFVYGFYKNAEHVFFMSTGQLNEYKRLFPTMNNWHENKLLVQGSTFSYSGLEYLDSLRTQRELNGHNNKWAILKGGSWIKNQEAIELYAKQNNLKYELIGGLPPKEFLKKLSEFEGILFFPKGFDTAPRIVIESAAIGLKLDLNENVQIKGEKWLEKPPVELIGYLRDTKDLIWRTIKTK